MKFNRLLMIFTISILLISESKAADFFVYSGKITKPDLQPLENPGVVFTIAIKSGTCVLYKETATVDMTGSKGYFSIPIGTNTQIYAPIAAPSTFYPGSFTCEDTSVASLTSTSQRNLDVSVQDGSNTISVGLISIGSVPKSFQAYNSSMFNGKLDTAFIQATGSVTQSALDALVVANGAASSIASKPVDTTLPTNGQVLAYDNASGKWTPTTPTSGGTLTSIVAGTGLTGGTITTSGTLAVDVGTTANKILQLDGSAKLPAVDGSLLTNISLTADKIVNAASKYFDYKPNNVACNNNEILKYTTGTGWVCSTSNPGTVTDVTVTSPLTVSTSTTTPALALSAGSSTGQTFRWNGSAWVASFLSMNDLRSTITGASALSTGCLANQTMTWTSATDNLSCTNISITKSQISDFPALAASATTDTSDASNISSGTLAAARLPAFTGDATSSAGTSALTLANSGVTAGTYKSVTVDAKGRVTNGTNPSTLSGYGITDAVPSSDSSATNLSAGLDAAKGSAAVDGKVYIATDTKKIYISAGSAWVAVGVTTATDLTVSGTPDGTKFLRDDGSWAAATAGVAAGTLCGHALRYCSGPGASSNVASTQCNGSTITSFCDGSGNVYYTGGCPAGYSGISFQTGQTSGAFSCIKN